MVPEATPPAQPAGVEIRGNVYRITCAGEPGGVPATIVSIYHLTMRFPPGAFQEIQYYDGSSWRAVAPLRAPGGHPYASLNAPGFGGYAADRPAGAPGPAIFSNLRRSTGFLCILGVLILFRT